MALVLSNQDYNNTSRIINLPAPIADTEPVRLQDLNSAVEGLSWKDSARVAAQANVNINSPGATIDGVTMALNDRVLLIAQTAPAENGIYVWNGAAVGLTRSLDASTAVELEAATLFVEEGTSAGSSYRQTSVNFTLGTGAVNWTVFGAAVPAASTTTAGVARYATQSEVDAGTVSNATVTPATLANYAARIKKFASTIGDGTSTAYAVTHNLNTLDVDVQVYRVTGGGTVIVDVDRTNVNTVTVTFASAPAANSYRVVVIG
jgi:hypothetical protein